MNTHNHSRQQLVVNYVGANGIRLVNIHTKHAEVRARVRGLSESRLVIESITGTLAGACMLATTLDHRISAIRVQQNS